MPTNIYVDSALPKYNYSQAMLTAELLKRNLRLNQEPIAEANAAQQKATLKLKRRISREPNTGKILIIPE